MKHLDMMLWTICLIGSFLDFGWQGGETAKYIPASGACIIVVSAEDREKKIEF